MKRFLTFICILYTSVTYSNSIRWVNVNTINSRPIAMGGAFQAIEDCWAAIYWNPATLVCNTIENHNFYRIRFNPFGIIELIKNKKDVDHDISPLAVCFPGVILEFNRICIGLLLGEESLANINRFEEEPSFWDARDYEWARNLEFSVRLKFAPRVSLGASIHANTLRKDDGGIKLGYRYGLLVKPKSYLHVGICYYNFPNSRADERINLERLPDETLNVGIAYQPVPQLLLSIDIRNVSDGGQLASLEPHFGIEIHPLSIFSFRTGYYQKNNELPVYSAGVGLKRQRQLFGTSFLSNVSYGIDATYVMEKQSNTTIRWCLLGVFIEF